MELRALLCFLGTVERGLQGAQKTTEPKRIQQKPMGFGNAPYVGPESQNVGSSCLCGLLALLVTVSDKERLSFGRLADLKRPILQDVEPSQMDDCW